MGLFRRPVHSDRFFVLAKTFDSHEMSIPLSQENIWFNKAQCDDAERLYYEKLAGAKTQEAEAEDDVDLFASDDEEEPPKAAPVKQTPKPVVKTAPKPIPVKKEPVPQKAAPEKIWTNKAECDDAEKIFQESLTQPGSYRNPVNAERTFLMLKPDAVHRGLVGVIMKRFEARGFKLLACKFMKASQELLKQHYIDLAKKR